MFRSSVLKCEDE